MKRLIILGMIIITSMNLSAAEDEGYFLSFSQKGQLIWRGQILGDDGNWYNIRIVPGYVAPTKYACEAWGDASDSFGEYFESKKYKDIADNSGDAYEWAFDKCVNKFIIKGIPESWSDYFGAASNKVEKRIFGWPMAYPVAVFQTFIDNIFRVTAGFTGCALGATAGTVIVPGYYMMDSTVKGGYYFIGPGMILPISGYTWNTVISPPLAVVGQKPSEARSDGYWVTKITPAEFEAKNKDLDEEDLKMIAEWGVILSKNLGKYDEECKKTDVESNKKVQEIYSKANKRKSELNKEESDEFQKMLSSPENREIVKKLEEMGMNHYTVSINYIKLKKSLADKNMSEEQAGKAYLLLMKYSNPKISDKKSISVDKTDPVRESIEVLKKTDK